MLKNIAELQIIFAELRDQVIAPPTSFFILAPNIFLCSHKGFSLNHCLFVLLEPISFVETNTIICP